LNQNNKRDATYLGTKKYKLKTEIENFEEITTTCYKSKKCNASIK
jgi:hypothetical protein